MTTFAPKNRLAAIRWGWQIGGVAAICLAAGVCWVCFTGPSLAARADLVNRAREIRAKHDTRQLIHDKCAAATREAADWEQVAAKMHARTTSHGAETAFLQWVNERAEALGLTIRDYRPANRLSHGEFDCRGLFLSSHGSYESICRFLDELRNCPRMCRVTSFELSPRDGGSNVANGLGPGADDYSFSLQVMLFSDSIPPKGA